MSRSVSRQRLFTVHINDYKARYFSRRIMSTVMGDQMCFARWKVARICQAFCLVGAENLFKSLEWLQIISAMDIVLSTSPPSFPSLPSTPALGRHLFKISFPLIQMRSFNNSWSMLSALSSRSLPSHHRMRCLLCVRIFHFVTVIGYRIRSFIGIHLFHDGNGELWKT